MEEIKDFNKAIALLNNNVLVSKNYGEPSLFYFRHDDKILIYNQYLSYTISINDFKNIFYDSKFYLYKTLEEIEINQEFKNLRQ